MEDYSNAVRIATIVTMFSDNLAINLGNLFFYPSANDISDDKMSYTVCIGNVVAMRNKDNDIVGSFIE